MARIYNQLFSMVLPLWKPSQAYRNALIYSYYGNFETAREELQKVEWGKYPPFVQSEKKYIEALAAFLEKKDFKQGLDLAKEALKLHEFASYIPGRRYLYLRFTTLIGIGQLLNGDQDTTILTSLEKEFRRYPVFSKVLIAWGLEKAYNQMGDIHQAEQMRAFINDTAPHCVAFVNNSVPKGPKDL
jgi:tetratricopeptide (TPR) repeat protein